MTDRPITTVTSDPNDLELLTPNHLLLLKTNPIIAPQTFPERGHLFKEKIEAGAIYS